MIRHNLDVYWSSEGNGLHRSWLAAAEVADARDKVLEPGKSASLHLALDPAALVLFYLQASEPVVVTFALADGERKTITVDPTIPLFWTRGCGTDADALLGGEVDAIEVANRGPEAAEVKLRVLRDS